MNHQFDELTKSMAQSVTRRGALKKIGLGLVGIALASLGLANKAQAQKSYDCNVWQYGCQRYKSVGQLLFWREAAAFSSATPARPMSPAACNALRV